MAILLLGIIYLSFVSLGLPDALLGAAWPMMHQQFQVPLSYAGGIALIISTGTVVSSLLADRIIRKLGTGKVTAISTAMTAVAIFGFSASGNFWQLCLWAIPYGLGAGSVDACLNNYVAIHYASRHMSWLHCMWGLGASIGPYIMGIALTGGMGWNTGYRLIGLLQIAVTALLFVSLPLWRSNGMQEQETAEEAARPLSFARIIAIPGAKEVMVAFFCYCALEQTAGLWASSYFVMKDGLDAESAAGFASLFYTGITVGRFLCGFVTYKVNDTNMIRLGEAVVAAGIVIMLLPIGVAATVAGLLLIGFGCAPIYPCIIHSTPYHFGQANSQALIGVQMASAYVGICIMPPLFGVIANHISAGLLPWYLTVLHVVMIWMSEKLNQKTHH